MIEDKELGLKVAINEEEKFWKEFEERCKKSIDNNKREIIINESLLVLCEARLKDENKV